MGRLPTIIAISSVVITGRIISPMIFETLTAFLMPPPPPTTVAVETVEYTETWKCPDCTPSEQFVLTELQTQTKITDRNALATLMGNIKQESKFIPNICEGGARVSYTNCLSGGYGLIQWTSAHRYRGLGTFCNKFSCDPS